MHIGLGDRPTADCTSSNGLSSGPTERMAFMESVEKKRARKLGTMLGLAAGLGVGLGVMTRNGVFGSGYNCYTSGVHMCSSSKRYHCPAPGCAWTTEFLPNQFTPATAYHIAASTPGIGQSRIQNDSQHNTTCGLYNLCEVTSNHCAHQAPNGQPIFITKQVSGVTVWDNSVQVSVPMTKMVPKQTVYGSNCTGNSI